MTRYPEQIYRNGRYTALRIGYMLCVCLFLLSFSFGYQLLPDPGRYTRHLFGPPVRWLGHHLFGLDASFKGKIASDTRGMYIDLLLVLLLALQATLILTAICRRRQKDIGGLYRFFTVCISYYLALQLLQYGWSKVFKWQFYLPEPNTLFTRIGDTPKDLLYWSTMGLSRSYTVFSGMVEVIPALLLLFRRTRILGAFILSGVMINVVWVNFSFDISVKIYSCFLLLLCFTVALPVYRLLYLFFVRKTAAVLSLQAAPSYATHRPWLYRIAKAMVVGLILLESLWLYLSTGNYNDDAAARPALHGAWQVSSYVKGHDTLASGKRPWERVFVHRRGYFIIQDSLRTMTDYRLHLDTKDKELTLEDYETGTRSHFSYLLSGDTSLLISSLVVDDSLQVSLKQIPLADLPALEKGFHWFSDD